MSIKQLVYISRSIRLMKSDELLPLLDEARQRNKACDITGMLLYKDRSFLQLLEGPENTITEIFSSICADSRHINLKTIIDIPVSQRSFSRWSMGFHCLNEQPISLPDAYTDFMSAPITNNDLQVSTKATELLRYFKVAS